MTFGCLLAGGGCDCDGTNLVGDASDLPVNPAETIGNPCRTDGECDDGEPCNGGESCDPEHGRCVGGTPLADFTQCTTTDGRYASCVDARCDLDYEEMFVPAGPFVMGADPDEDTSCDVPCMDAWPERIVEVSGYFIDRYEVTNKKYARCQARGVCPYHRDGSFLRETYFTNPAYAYFPLIFVGQRQAIEYCAHEGKRLPTEAEWEKAARGGCEVVPPETCGDEDERDLPWDWPPFGEYEDRLTCERANWGSYVGYGDDERCPNDTSRVGLRPAGRSPYGVDDMLGNVREIVADCAERYVECPGGCVDPWGSCDGWPDPDDPVVAVRGGSWAYSCEFLVHRSATRRSWLSDNRNGFRCVRPVGGSKSVGTPWSGAAADGTQGEGRDDEESNGASGALAAADFGMALAGGGSRLLPRRP